jgi:hypothetical protein
MTKIFIYPKNMSIFRFNKIFNNSQNKLDIFEMIKTDKMLKNMVQDSIQNIENIIRYICICLITFII